MKFYSNLSNTNKCYYLKIRIPMCHRQFCRIVSQIQEFVKTHCNDRNYAFHFACQR